MLLLINYDSVSHQKMDLKAMDHTNILSLLMVLVKSTIQDHCSICVVLLGFSKSNITAYQDTGFIEYPWKFYHTNQFSQP